MRRAYHGLVLSALILCTSLASAPIEVLSGAGVASAARQDIYSLWNGPEPVVALRIFSKGFYVQGMTEVALMPVVIYTGPTGPALQQSYAGAFTIQQTFLLGYRFHLDETWSVALAGGLGANYHLEVSGDSGSGAPYASLASQFVVAARISPVFAVEGSAIGSAGYLGVARGALTLAAVFRFE